MCKRLVLLAESLGGCMVVGPSVPCFLGRECGREGLAWHVWHFMEWMAARAPVLGCRWGRTEIALLNLRSALYVGSTALAGTGAGLGAPTPGGPSLLRLLLLLLVGEPEAFQSGLFTTDCCLSVHRMGWAAAAPVAKRLQESKKPDWCCTFLLL